MPLFLNFIGAYGLSLEISPGHSTRKQQNMRLDVPNPGGTMLKFLQDKGMATTAEGTQAIESMNDLVTTIGSHVMIVSSSSTKKKKHMPQ